MDPNARGAAVRKEVAMAGDRKIDTRISNYDKFRKQPDDAKQNMNVMEGLKTGGKRPVS